MKTILIISLLLFAGCSAKFDSFDPTTSALKWVLTNDR
jgi:hypothetical protein